jgi:hypothetical protein
MCVSCCLCSRASLSIPYKRRSLLYHLSNSNQGLDSLDILDCWMAELTRTSGRSGFIRVWLCSNSGRCRFHQPRLPVGSYSWHHRGRHGRAQSSLRHNQLALSLLDGEDYQDVCPVSSWSPRRLRHCSSGGDRGQALGDLCVHPCRVQLWVATSCMVLPLRLPFSQLGHD